MPQVPVIIPRIPLSVPEFASQAPAFEAIGRFSEALSKINEASDMAEGDRVAAELSAEVKNTIRQKTLEVNDPNQFNTEVNDALEKLRESKLSGLSYGVLARVKQRTAGLMADAQGDVQYVTAKKGIQKAQGQSFTFLEDKERELFDATDPTTRAEKEAEIRTHLQNAVSAGIYNQEGAAKLFNGIKEREAYALAKRELEVSNDPVRDLTTLAQRYPNIDRMKIVNELNGFARARQKEIDEISEKARKQIKEENLSDDYSRAISGQMTPTDFEITVKARRYTPAEANSIKAAMEEGGATDPNVYTRLENDILQGGLRNQALIATNRSLGRADKSNLMRLIESQIRQDRMEQRQLDADRRTRHFSTTPEYQQAVREYRSAISTKGELAPLDDKENQRYNFGLKQLWDRAEKGENPLQASRELISRLTPREIAGDPPSIMPRFKTDQELITALKRKQITEAVAAQEAELMLQWEQWRERLASSIQRPQAGQQGNQSGRRNNR